MSNLGRVVKFTNIDKEDFQFAFGGQPFLVKAGESVFFPYDLAEHGAKHLANKILLRGDKALSIYDPSDKSGGMGINLITEDAHQAITSKVMAEEITVEESKPKTEMELLLERVKQLEKLAVSDEKESEEKVSVSTSAYQDKAEVIAELNKRGIKYDARTSKENLEKLLTETV